MINLAKVGVIFRPVICWSQADSLPDVARKSFLGITPVNASDFFQCTSITFNGNQIQSQSSISQSTPRTLFMNYYNQLSAKKKNMMTSGDYLTGLCTELTGGLLNQVVGTEETLLGTHPYDAAGNTIATKVDADPFPRALLSKVWSYNMEHSLPPTNGPALTGNAYYGGTFDPIGSSASPYNFGGVPQPAGNGAVAGQSGDAALAYPVNFPMISLMITPSVAQYKGCQEKFQCMRMRFLTATTTSYPYTGTAAIQTNTSNPIGMPLAANYAETIILGNDGAAQTGPQRQVYGTSVQGPYGCGQTAQSNAPARYLGQQWTSTNATYFPQEQYTNLYFELGEVSIELAQIQTCCMDSTQVIVLLQTSNANQVLSAYLQTGYFATSGISVKPAPGGANQTWHSGPSSADCQAFLSACLVGSATYKITDICLRIPYEIYPESSYGIVRDLLYQPISFQSLRIQVEPITNIQSSFTQRIAIGGSALINGVFTFILPNCQPLTNQSAPLRPQDCVIDYMGLQPPSVGDLRCVPTYDALYLPFSQYSVFLDSAVFEASPLIPISNQAFATYLKTQEAWEQVFGKHLNVDLRSFLTNRSSIGVGINQNNDRGMMVSDQSLVITVQWDGSSRLEHAKAMGSQKTQYLSGDFLMYTVIVTSQSLVNMDYIKI